MRNIIVHDELQCDEEDNTIAKDTHVLSLCVSLWPTTTPSSTYLLR